MVRRACWGSTVVATVLVCSPSVFAADFPDISLPDFSLPDLPIPPLFTSGNAGYVYQTNRSSGEVRNHQHQLNGTLIGSSYIWQPWFATVNGFLTASSSQQTTADQGTTAGNVTGEMNLSILPVSKFPTTLAYSRTDTTQSSISVDDTGVEEETSGWTRSDAVSIASSVQWDDTMAISSNGSYSLSTQQDAGDTAASTLALAVDKNFEEQTIGVSLGYSSTVQDTAVAEDGEESEGNDLSTITASLRHQYVPWENVSYDSTSGVLQSTDATDSQTSKSFAIQGTSTLRWTPEEYPFSASAVWSGNSSESETSFTSEDSTSGDTSSKSTLYSGQIGLMYEFTPRITANATLDGSYSDTESEATEASDSSSSSSTSDDEEEEDLAKNFTVGGSAGINYSADQIQVQEFLWNWNGALSGQVSSGSSEEVSHSQSLSVGQHLTTNFDVPYLGWIQWTGGENLSAQHSSGGDGLTPTVSHTMMTAYQEEDGEKWTLLSASFSDSRTFALTEDTTSQLVNAQISKGIEPDGFSSWTANLTLQASRTITVSKGTSDTSTTTDDDSEDNSIWSKSSTGSLTYNRKNVFGFRNLDFGTTLSLTADGLYPLLFDKKRSDNVVSDTTADLIEEEDIPAWSRSVTGTLKYSIGQIALQGRVRFTQNYKNEVTDQFQFNLIRAF